MTRAVYISLYGRESALSFSRMYTQTPLYTGVLISEHTRARNGGGSYGSSVYDTVRVRDTSVTFSGSRPTGARALSRRRRRCCCCSSPPCVPPHFPSRGSLELSSSHSRAALYVGAPRSRSPWTRPTRVHVERAALLRSGRSCLPRRAEEGTRYRARATQPYFSLSRSLASACTVAPSLGAPLNQLSPI